MFDEPKRKPKRKRKRDESIVPYVIVFGLVILVLVGSAGVFLLMREPQQQVCLDASAPCATPTPLPFVLYPTSTPLMPPEMIGQYATNGVAPNISSLALAPDQQHLLVGLQYPADSDLLGRVASLALGQSDDGRLILDEEIASYPLVSSQLRIVDDIDIQPQNAFFSLGSLVNQTVEIYDKDAAELADAVPSPANSPIAYQFYSDLAFSPDGRFYVIAGSSGISLRDVETLSETSHVEGSDESYLVDMAFNSTSTKLIVAQGVMSPYLKTWYIEEDTLQESAVVTLPRQILDIDVHPTLDQVAVAMPGMIAIYDIDSNQLETYIVNEAPAISSVAYHLSGNLLVFGGSHDAVSGALYAMPLDDEGYAIFTDEQININNMGFTSGPISELLYDASGRTLFVGTTNGGLYTWDSATSQPVDQFIFE
ncbi:WD40 repeat domain-containing protein [Phototrophicus methaneseepsis]|uniref:WD40 repeat domain-containing protein n=1 Tax=Phototrophicus methaneseepsis TaxID=2710758 RepID=A0A7S8E8N3_9CHLR|nr:WD40 repeat domain-containing protein [Phototrophicus methaneseepsis]QPC82279.1 WD40 repeat domain-containing protein [Phototrophicus methaneseepsis]